MLPLFSAAACAAALLLTGYQALAPWYGHETRGALALAGLLALAGWLGPRVGSVAALGAAVVAALAGAGLCWAGASGALAPLIAATAERGPSVAAVLALLAAPGLPAAVALSALARRSDRGAVAAGLGGLTGAAIAVLATIPAVGLTASGAAAGVGLVLAALVAMRGEPRSAPGPAVAAAVAGAVAAALAAGLSSTGPSPAGPEPETWRSRRDAGSLGHLAVFLHGAPARGLLIGDPEGPTAAALRAHANLTELEVVPAERARRHLLSGGAPYDLPYDLIVAPGAASAPELATAQFHALVPGRLAERGVFVQPWHGDRMPLRESRASLSAALEPLPHAALFNDPGGVPVLVTSPAPLAVDLEDWLARGRASAGALGGLGLDAERLLASYAMGRHALERLSLGTPPLTDDHPGFRAGDGVALPERTGDPFGLVGLLVDLPPDQLPALDDHAALRGAAEAAEAAWRALPLAQLSPPYWRELIFGTAVQSARCTTALRIRG